MIALNDPHLAGCQAVLEETLEGLIDERERGHAERDPFALAPRTSDDVGGDNGLASSGRELEHGTAMACQEGSREALDGGLLMGVERTEAGHERPRVVRCAWRAPTEILL